MLRGLNQRSSGPDGVPIAGELDLLEQSPFHLTAIGATWNMRWST
jgi:hypothetical protein